MTDVAIVSAVPAVRAGLRVLLQAAGHRVAGEAARADAPSFDGAVGVAVFDAGPAAELHDALAAAALAPGLVILGSVAGGARLPAALAGRPFAYLPRDASAEQLAAAVAAVAAGLAVFDPATSADLFAPASTGHSTDSTGDSIRPIGAAGLAGSGAGSREGQDGAEPLTAREREVLQLVAEGLPNKNISRRLGISEHTVKFHVASVMAKLGAASRTEAVHLAARRGQVTL